MSMYSVKFFPLQKNNLFYCKFRRGLNSQNEWMNSNFKSHTKEVYGVSQRLNSISAN